MEDVKSKIFEGKLWEVRHFWTVLKMAVLGGYCRVVFSVSDLAP